MALRSLVGLMLAGYGLLVVVGVLPHDAFWAGAVSLVLGAVLLAWGLPKVSIRRGRVVAALGAVAATGVVGYNLAMGSGMSLPEWGILAYGVALMAASRRLESRVGKVQVGTLVAWSFPLLLAPLSLFALNAGLSDGATAANPVIHRFIVLPTAMGLRLVGTPVDVVGNNLILSTPRGGLTLGVGLVCAGIYPMVLFLGLVGLHAWNEKVGWKRLAAYIAAGLAGLWLVNILRMVALAKVGIRWGPVALQTAHANLGWILFALFMVAFWAVVLRRAPAKPA